MPLIKRITVGVAIALFGLAGMLWIARPDQPAPYPRVTVAPEDLQRLENEAYNVCAAYANLDLSGMVTMCKLVHYQQ